MSDLEPIQLERLRAIGEQLRLAREAKGLSLEEASAKTLIRATILKAIEDGNASPLPEPVYIRGFIRRFGDVVGLKGKELCETFPWEPSHSVTLSFVPSGDSLVAASTVQAPVAEAPVAEAPKPVVEPSLEQASGTSLGEAVGALEQVDSSEQLPVSDSPVTDAVGPDVVEVEPGSSDRPISVDVSGGIAYDFGNASSAQVEGTVASEGEQGSETSAATNLTDDAGRKSEDASASLASVDSPPQMTDYDVAYKSRAALFEDSDEQGDVNSATSTVKDASVVAISAAASAPEASLETPLPAVSEAEASSSSPQVATLPPPPAPVSYAGEPSRPKFAAWFFPLLGAALALGIAAFALTANRQPKTVVSGEAEAEAPAAEAVVETPAPNPEPAPPKPAAIPADQVVLELEIKGTEEAWMDVRVDGEILLEGNQASGFKQRWQGKENIELATARPDLVWISVNGGESQPFGTLAEANPFPKLASFKPSDGR